MIRNFSKIRSLRQFTADSQEVQIVAQTASQKLENRIELLSSIRSAKSNQSSSCTFSQGKISG